MSFIKESLNLKGKTALITGSSGQLGKVFAECLGELGCDLILVDLDGTALKEESERLHGAYKVEVKTYNTDLESRSQRSLLIEKVKSDTSNLNFLINNAAFVGNSQLSGWSGTFETQSVETWSRAIEVNLTASFEIIQGLTPVMKNSIGANIVNISSMYGIRGPTWELYEGTTMGNPAAYAASKGGLIQLTRWLATTLAPFIRVNSIAPGGIKSNQPKEFIERYERKVPLARMGTPVDVAGALVFLLTDLSQYVTGQVIEVDGGWGVW